MKQRYLYFGIDLLWIAASPFIALFIRDNFEPLAEALSAVFTYAAMGVIAGIVVIPLAGLNRGFWRYTGLPDLLRLMGSVTAIVLLTLFATFAFSRLDSVARSLPVIQWLVLFAGMAGSRIATRVWRERRHDVPDVVAPTGTQDVLNVLIVGVNPVAELYLRSIAEFAPRMVSVVGLLAPGAQLPGRVLRSHKVLGHPEDLPRVVRDLEIHGVSLDRVIVVEPLERLSQRAVEGLLTLERSSTIRVDWILDLLGFDSREGREDITRAAFVDGATGSSDPVSSEAALAAGNKYGQVKRVMDAIGAAMLIVVLAPLGIAVAVLTAFNVGPPVVFWQKRPGRYGYPFKLYKFRTMRGAHDRYGNRIPDQERSSRLGAWLRRTRLDELPQLYNILVGEMSFVGPRPLLPIDQATVGRSLFLVRPGLTGWSQVNGGRQLSAEDKAALDAWYVGNMSLSLDIRIVLHTCLILWASERVNQGSIAEAQEALASLESIRGVQAANPARPDAGKKATLTALDRYGEGPLFINVTKP